MQRTTLIGIVVLGIAACAIAFYFLENGASRLSQSYTDSAYGFSFRYPDTYTLTSHVPTSSSDWVEEITLINKAIVVPPNSDGPTLISVEVYHNDSDQRQLENWIRGSAASNFTSSDGRLNSTTLAGVPAYFYRWDGLYPAQTFAIEHNDSVILFSVSYNADTDRIRQDFSSILDSITLQ